MPYLTSPTLARESVREASVHSAVEVFAFSFSFTLFITEHDNALWGDEAITRGDVFRRKAPCSAPCGRLENRLYIHARARKRKALFEEPLHIVQAKPAFYNSIKSASDQLEMIGEIVPSFTSLMDIVQWFRHLWLINRCHPFVPPA